MKRFANKSKFSPFYALLQLPGIIINEVHIKDSEISIVAEIKSKSGFCPRCGKKSKSIHSFYYRNLQDLSIVEKQVNIKLAIRKFFCQNKRCSNKIFSQQLTSGLDRHARRTSRANQQLTQMSLETSARKSSWLSKLIRIPVSPSTCLRLANNCVLPSADQIPNIGIDDWAYRKGISYGTIFVDMDQGRVVDLLPGRDGNEVKNFLQSHKEIRSVCRDRSGAYSAAVNEVIPSASQVADRFHLVKNLSESVYQLVKSEYAGLVKSYKSSLITAGDSAIIKKEKEISVKTRQKQLHVKGSPSDYRKTIFNEVKFLLEKGFGFKTISTRLKISRNTVRRYAGLNTLPNKSFMLRNDYLSYLPIIEREMQHGGTLKSTYQIIVNQGFTGSMSAFYEQFKNHPVQLKKREQILIRDNITQHISVLCPRKISIFLSFEDLSMIKNEKEKQQMKHILGTSNLLNCLRQQVLSFRNILKKGTPRIVKSMDDKYLNSEKENPKYIC